MFRIRHQVFNHDTQEYEDVPLDDCPNHIVELTRLLTRHAMSEAEVKAYIRRSMQDSH